MKKYLKYLGLVVVAFGFVQLTFQIIQTIGSSKTDAVIVNVLERNDLEYTSVQKGSNKPCKLEIGYAKLNNEQETYTTSYEQGPCRSLYHGYFSQGASITILYKENTPFNPMLITESYLVLPVLMVVFGIAWFFLAKKQLAE